MDEAVTLPSHPRADSDLELMAAVAASAATAQRRLLERVSARVERVARLLSSRGVDPEDAAQLSLLEILGSAANFRISTSLERWADRITARTTLRLVRREHARQNLLVRWLSPDTLPWGRRAAVCDEPLDLETILARLSPERREALVLHHALEYSVDEIAELTGAPTGTIKDRLVSGRKQLRRMLEREGAPSPRREQRP